MFCRLGSDKISGQGKYLLPKTDYNMSSYKKSEERKPNTKEKERNRRKIIELKLNKRLTNSP
jgi:hypothetical protein